MANDYIKLTRNIKKAGIPIKGQFIYGFGSDTFVTFWKLWWSSVRINPMLSGLSLFTPIPNSRFYKEIEEQDRFINLNWNRIDLMTLTYDHPVLNNPLFRDGFYLVTYFFFITTSVSGYIFLTVMAVYFLLGLF
jgi:hypothetical protein